jgi:hypothetical protein
MKILLITNSPIANPGIVVPNDKKDFFDLYKEEIESRSVTDIVFGFPSWDAAASYFNQKEVKVHPARPAIGGEDGLLSKIQYKSLIVPKRTIVKANLDYDSELFCGAFKSGDYFQSMVSLLPTDDSEFVICNIGEVNRNCDKKVSGVGLHLVHESGVSPASNYSNFVWEYLRQGVVEVFGNLNAKRVSLKDKTNIEAAANISLSKSARAAIIEAGLLFDKKCSYEISCELNGTLDTKKASQSLHKLRMFSVLNSLAQQGIENPTHLKSVSQSVQLDVSFGIDVNLLTLLQGAFAGGYTREFDLKIEF